MAIKRKCDFQFGSDAINTRHQDRLPHPGKIRGEKTAESANFSKDLRSMRTFDPRLDIAFNQITEVNIDSGAGVCFFLVTRGFHRFGVRWQA